MKSPLSSIIDAVKGTNRNLPYPKGFIRILVAGLVLLLMPGFYHFGWGQTTTQTFVSSGTFTVPAGVTSVTVKMWGGGGGGGILANKGAGGGGGGAFAQVNSMTVVPGNNYTVTIGAGGARGYAGGSSIFNGVTANGGSSSNNNVGGVGGSLVDMSGDIIFAGGNGGTADNANKHGGGGGGAAGSSAGAGADGSANNKELGGSGGVGVNGAGSGGSGGDYQGDGSAGFSPGGGGGGEGDENDASGAGGAGMVLISWSCSNTLTSAAGTNAQTVCVNTAITNITYAITGSTGTTVSGLPAGVTGNYNSGIFTISGTPTATGTFSYTVTPTGGCTGNTATGTITVKSAVGTPVFTLGATSTRCQGAGTVTYTATATNSTGITYTLDATSLAGGNTIVAATGAVTWASTWTGTSIITASAAGCSTPATATHTVTITPTVTTPVFTLGASSTRCQGSGSENYTAYADNTTGIVFSLDAASISGGNSIVSGTGAVTYAATWSGTTLITASAAGCNGPATAVHTVTVFKNPDLVATGATSICNGTTTNISLTSSVSGATFSWTIGVITGGITGASASSGPTIAQLLTNPGTVAGTVTYIVRPEANGCSGPAYSIVITVYPTLTVAATPTLISCVGSSTGTITATGNGGMPPYQYKLNSGTFQSGNTFIDLAPGIYTLWITDALNCSGSTSVTVSQIAPPTDDQNSSALNSWKGHVYDGLNFNTYAGYITQAESFSTNFGADNDTYCIPLLSNGTSRGSILNSTFSVRFRMNSDKNGLYLVDLLSDDGIALRIDGTLVFRDWTDHAPRAANNVLVPLNGSSQLVLEYYENTGNNQVAYNNIRKIQNSLTINTNQTVCEGFAISAVSGTLLLDNGNALPTGITGSYKWYYLKTPSTTWMEIAGEAGSSYTPSLALFALPGTYKIKNAVTITSANNTGSTSTVTGIVQTNEATITVSPTPSATISYTGTPYCFNAGLVPVTQTGTVGGTYSAAPAGLTLNATTGVINTNSSSAGTYTVTYTIAPSGGCNVFTTTATLTIIGDRIWTGAISADWNVPGNWSCSALPDLTTNAQIPNVANKPILSAGAIGAAKNITIESGSSLTVTGNTIQIGETITNNGTFTATAGTVELKGSAAQVIGAGVFAGNTIMNLTLNNSAGAALLGPLSITGIVKAAAGTLNSGGNLTLVSSSSQTALIDGSGAGQVSGAVTMQRYLPSAFGYKYVSSPFQDATVNEFADDLDLSDPVTSFPHFYSYDEENHRDSSGIAVYQSGWVKYLATTNPLIPFRGYAANFGASAASGTFDITGTVNNGPVQVALISNNREYTKGFDLVGNPYPSPIDWNLPGWTKANIDNAIYFFNASGPSQYTGVYSSYIGGVSTGNGNNLIASMQGFFVHVTDGSYPVNATLGITNTARTNDLNPEYKKGFIDNRSILRFTASFETQNSIEDVAVVYFDNNANPEFDKEMDALKMANTDLLVPNVYTFSQESKQLSINGLPILTDSIAEIPLGLTTLSDGWIVFNAKDISTLPSGYYIYLFDSENGIIQNLEQYPVYRFNLKAGEYNQRFSLVLSLSEILGPADIYDKMFRILRSDEFLQVKMSLPFNTRGTLLVTNMGGQVVLQKDVFGNETVEINSRICTGVYVVTLISGSRKHSEKILMRTNYE